MKKAFLCPAFIFATSILLLAQKYDYQWIVPGQLLPPDGQEQYLLDFNDLQPLPSVVGTNLGLIFNQANTGICDPETGTLLFYSNGTHILNASHELIANGDSINAGEVTDFSGIYGYPVGLNMLTLPAPGLDNIYYIFHLRSVPDTIPIFFRNPDALYTIIDMLLGNELGGVTEKNKLLAQSWSFSIPAAVKHANGRDWWILLPEWKSTKIHRFLLDANGIEAQGFQEFNFPIDDSLNRAGYNIFSPDGNFYVDYDIHNGIRVFDFDRCTGMLNDFDLVPSPDLQNGGIGAAISPNSRFLYICSDTVMYQYDMWATDIKNSAEIVAVWDGYLPPPAPPQAIELYFGYPTISPNGKILISSIYFGFYHSINHPNNKGSSCEVIQRAIPFEKLNFSNVGIFPNYRLGPLDGSPCDTLGLDNHPLAGFTWEADSINPLLVQFTDNSFYEPIDWLWDFGGTGSSTEVDPVHTFPAPGTYTICLTVSNQYDSDTFCREVEVGTVGVEENKEENFAAIFPNPASSNLHLALQLPGTRRTILLLYDATGREVRRWETQAGQGTYTFPLGDLAAGLYFWQVALENGRAQSGKLNIVK